MRKKLLKIALIILVLFLLLPIPNEIVPEWKIQVRRKDGSAVQDVIVYQSTSNVVSLIGLPGAQQNTRSDSDGEVVFPRQVSYSPPLLRILDYSLSKIAFWSPNKYGVLSSVYVSSSYETIYYKTGEEPPRELIID